MCDSILHILSIRAKFFAKYGIFPSREIGVHVLVKHSADADDRNIKLADDKSVKYTVCSYQTQM